MDLLIGREADLGDDLAEKSKGIGKEWTMIGEERVEIWICGGEILFGEIELAD